MFYVIQSPRVFKTDPCLRRQSHNRLFGILIIAIVAFYLQPLASAENKLPATKSKPKVYTPDGIHVSAQIHSNSPYTGDPAHEPFGSVEAWYFKDSCIVKQTYRLTDGPAEQRVYSYRYHEDSPSREPVLQQWGTPRAIEFLLHDPTRLPYDAIRINPLWYMIDLKDRLTSDDVQLQVRPLADGRRLIEHFNKPFVSEPRTDRFQNLYLLENDQIQNITLTIHTTYHQQKSAPNFNPPSDHSSIAYELTASDFDENFPSIPRSIIVNTWHGSGRTFKIESISAIPSDVDARQIIAQVTERLHPIELDQHGHEVTYSANQFSLISPEGDSVKLSEIIKGKTALVYSWASWAPKSSDIITALAELSETLSNQDDISIISISLDGNTTASAELTKLHAPSLPNYSVPFKLQRAAVKTFTTDSSIPSAAVIDRRGVITPGSLKEVAESITGSTAFDGFHHTLKTDRAAKEAGGYAKHWLGPQVLEVLAGFESAEICKLTGDHMEELMAAADAPALPPPPPGPGQRHVLTAPVATPRVHNMPTSVSILGNYPVKSKTKLPNKTSARTIARMLTNDKAVIKQFGEEAYPSPHRAIVFHKGKDAVALVGEGPDIEIYLNDKSAAWLWLSPEATTQLQKFYQKLMH